MLVLPLHKIDRNYFMNLLLNCMLVLPLHELDQNYFMNLVMLSISIHVAGRTEKAARDDVRKEAMPTLPTGRERVLSRK